MNVQMPNHELFKRNGRRMGRLLDDFTYNTPIKGFSKELRIENFRCQLHPDGRLKILALSEWDFGTGAIDTPAMVYGSLAHDALCHMTNHRLLPWSVRAQADRFLWQCLTAGGATVSRLWRVPLVMMYSQLIARWRDKR